MLSYTETNDDFVNVSDIKTETLGAFYNSIEAERHQQFVDFILKKIKSPTTTYKLEIHSLMSNEPWYNNLLETYTNAFHPELSHTNNLEPIYPLNHNKKFEALYDDIDTSTKHLESLTL
jgi:hypothetical protein